MAESVKGADRETRQRRGRRVWHLRCGLKKLNTWTHHLFRTAERRRIRKNIWNHPKLTKTHQDIKPNRTNGSGKANVIASNPEWGFFFSFFYKIGLYREKRSLGEEREPWPCLMFGSSWCSTATLGYLRHITSHHDHHKKFKWIWRNYVEENRKQNRSHWDEIWIETTLDVKKGTISVKLIQPLKVFLYQFAQKLCFLCSSKSRKLVMQNDVKQACSRARWWNTCFPAIVNVYTHTSVLKERTWTNLLSCTTRASFNN